MPLQHAPIDFVELRRIHALKRLRLSFSRGLQGYVDLDGDPEALVDELMRLALVGQTLERLALEHPTRMLSHAVDEAQR